MVVDHETVGSFIDANAKYLLRIHPGKYLAFVYGHVKYKSDCRYHH